MFQSIPATWWIAPISAILALGTAFVFFKKLLSEDEGTDRMKEIAGYVKEGAMAYLHRQYKVVGKVFAIIFVLLAILRCLNSLRCG